MIVDFRRSPPLSPTDHHEQHCDCSGVSQIPGHHHLSEPEVGQSHWLYREKGPAEVVLHQLRSSTCHKSCWNSCSSITFWFGSATKTDIRRLQRTVRTAERIIGALLTSLQELYTSRVRRRAKKVTLDHSHQAHSLFKLLPSDQCYRAPSTKTARHKNSFYPQAISHLNNT